MCQDLVLIYLKIIRKYHVIILCYLTSDHATFDGAVCLFGNGQHGLCQHHRKPKHAPLR
ncbi:hypothetical protein [Moraxella lacunata]|uniref:hypothetical protein n=1 Tax=Moraxella lacunata TaxID=477 RepID=UPI003EE147B2